MKSRIVNQQDNTPKIDWGKKQIVRSITAPKLLVLVTGKYKDGLFSGVVITDEGTLYSVGEYKQDWFMESFTPVTTPVTIEFIPE